MGKVWGRWWVRVGVYGELGCVVDMVVCWSDRMDGVVCRVGSVWV